MPIAELTTATLETIGRPKPSKYEGKPDYRPLLFNLADGSQRWKSFNVDAPELAWLKKGQSYQATLAGDEFTLIRPQQPAPAPATGSPEPDTPGTTRGAYLEALGRLGARYGECLKESQKILGQGLGLTPDQLRDRPEMIKDIATTFFIQLQRELS